MSRPIPVEILSDEEVNIEISPSPFRTKKRRTGDEGSPTVLVLDDDPTPQKPNPIATPSIVLETPRSDLSKFDVSIVKCTAGLSEPSTRPLAAHSEEKASGISGLICLESDTESESGLERECSKEIETTTVDFGFAGLSSRFAESTSSIRAASLVQIGSDSCVHDEILYEDVHQMEIDHDKGNVILKQSNNINQQKGRIKEKENRKAEANAKKKQMKEERIRLNEERKLKKEEEKMQKAALKAEAAAMKKLEKEKQKWEKGKFALKSIVAQVDSKVVELGSIGGHLLTRFAEKGLTFRITSNPIERSILWTMTVPEEISQLSSKGSEVPYVLLVYEADEFCSLVIKESILDHVCKVQSHYPSYTICYLTNKLMAYINKREQGQYKNPTNNNCWRRPPVEEVLSKIATHFTRVHSRQCIDEAEVAEHVIGLTCSLASCQFRKKLTRLSVNADGTIARKDFIDSDVIKKNVWLKALVAIPKVQPRFAIAIWKKYPTMKSLLSAYMDPRKSVHEKEFLLKDLMTEGSLGNEDRRLGEVCSKRVYRILMAQSGSIKTDDVEDGADFFRHQSS